MPFLRFLRYNGFCQEISIEDFDHILKHKYLYIECIHGTKPISDFLAVFFYFRYSVYKMPFVRRGFSEIYAFYLYYVEMKKKIV